MQTESQISDMTHDELVSYIEANLDMSSIDPQEAAELVVLLEEKKRKEREALWLVDPVEWSVDNLGLRRDTVKWSTHPAYEGHKWQSRIYSRESEEEDSKYIHVPCVDPIDEMCRSVANLEQIIAIASCTGSGKSYMAAHLVLWWLWRYKNSKVIFFANKIDQIRVNIGGELEELFPQFKNMFPDAAFNRGSMRLYVDNSDESAREKWSARAYGAARSSKDDAAGGAKGSHAEYQMTIFEEAQSADQTIVRSVLDGFGGSGNIALFLGNPLSKLDRLYQVATMPAAKWIGVSAYDCPNVVHQDEKFVPGGISQGNIDMHLKNAYGDVNDPKFTRLVRGIFPNISEYAILSEQAAKEIEVERAENAPVYEKYESEELQGYAAFWRTGPREDYVRWCYVGVDIAGDSAVSGDYSVAVFYDRVSNEPFGLVRVRGDRSDFFEQVIKYCHKFATSWWRRGVKDLPLLAYERNTHAPTKESSLLKYPNLYRPSSMDKKGVKRSGVYGWYTNRRTRVELQERLKAWLREVQADPTILYIEDIKEELCSFVGEQKGDAVRYEAAPGMHDDTVMALGIVLSVSHEHYNRPPLQIEGDIEQESEKPGTFPRGSAYKGSESISRNLSRWQTSSKW